MEGFNITQTMVQFKFFGADHATGEQAKTALSAREFIAECERYQDSFKGDERAFITWVRSNLAGEAWMWFATVGLSDDVERERLTSSWHAFKTEFKFRYGLEGKTNRMNFKECMTRKPNETVAAFLSRFASKYDDFLRCPEQKEINGERIPVMNRDHRENLDTWARAFMRDLKMEDREATEALRSMHRHADADVAKFTTQVQNGVRLTMMHSMTAMVLPDFVGDQDLTEYMRTQVNKKKLKIPEIYKYAMDKDKKVRSDSVAQDSSKKKNGNGKKNGKKVAEIEEDTVDTNSEQVVEANSQKNKNGKNNTSKGGSKTGPPLQCQVCDKKGHTANKCFKLINKIKALSGAHSVDEKAPVETVSNALADAESALNLNGLML